MFTGLVEGVGQISRITPKGPDAVLVIKPTWSMDQVVMGESVAVNGACLTVTGIGGGGFSLDVSAETLSRTKVGKLRQGDPVNLERAMQLGDRLGGHLVTGHVDCLGKVVSIARHGDSVRLEISIPPEHLRYVVEKGSVTVDGVSLTVNQLWPDRFGLNIIPHTWQETTLHLVTEGDSVNIETDLIGKYVARLLNRGENDQGQKEKGLTAEDLLRAGF